MGYHQSTQVQTLENTFLRLSPKSDPTAFCHSEVWVDFIADWINIAPLILWAKVWLSEDLKLTRVLVNVEAIPWFHYVKGKFNGMGLGHYENTTSMDTNMKLIKHIWMSLTICRRQGCNFISIGPFYINNFVFYHECAVQIFFSG